MDHQEHDQKDKSSSGRRDESVLDEYYVIYQPESPIIVCDSNNEHTKSEVDAPPKNNDAATRMPLTEKDNALVQQTERLRSGAHAEMCIKQHATENRIVQDIPRINCPRVDCPEKIIICLDLSEEMETTTFRSRSGDKYSGLELAKRTIRMFVMHKSQMNPKHEFAFLVFQESPTLIKSFTSRTHDILSAVDESRTERQKSGPLNLSHLFDTIKVSVKLPIVRGDREVIPPPFVIRVLLIFGRSHSVPVVTDIQCQKVLESSPYFFTDVLYIHEPPTEDNKCEEIFPVLCDLDHNGMSYIFEQSKYTPILNSGAKLLAHPLQRPRQLDAAYKIGPPPTAPPPTQLPPQVTEERVF